MRVTSSNSANRYIRGLQSNAQRLDKVNQQIVSQKNIGKVSDDPIKAVKAINLRNEISTVEGLDSNAEELIGWLDNTDSALGAIGDCMSEIKRLLTSVSGHQDTVDIEGTRKEIIEKIKQISELFDSSYQGQKIFSGSSTSEKPVDVVINKDGTVTIGKTQGINNDSLRAEVSPGIVIDYNSTVDEVTKNGEMFDTLNDIVRTLNTIPVDMNEVGKLQSRIDSAIDGILSARSTVGAKSNTIEHMRDANKTNIEKMTETYSAIQYIDLAEKTIELKSSELVYTASLQVGARLMQNSILDYIR